MGIREDAITRVTNIFAELAGLNSTKLGGKANTSQAGGGSVVDHVGYKDGLLRELEAYKTLLGVSTLDELEDMVTGGYKTFVIESTQEI